MYDFAKMRFPRQHYREALRANPVLHWEPAIDRYKRMNATEIAPWGDLVFLFNPQASVFEVSGSLHKTYHEGTNHQDFTRSQFMELVEKFSTTFHVPPFEVQLANLEVGANVVTSVSPALLLKYVLCHGQHFPEAMDPPAVGIVFRYRDKNGKNYYRLKLYDKGRQYGLEGNVLRFEMHIDVMRLLKPFGVVTLADLLEPEKWIALQGFLLKKFDALFIVEPCIDQGTFLPSQRALITKAMDRTFWEGLSRQRRSEKRATLRRLYDLHADPNLKKSVRELIAAKLTDLNELEVRQEALCIGRIHPVLPSGEIVLNDATNGTR